MAPVFTVVIPGLNGAPDRRQEGWVIRGGRYRPKGGVGVGLQPLPRLDHLLMCLAVGRGFGRAEARPGTLASEVSSLVSDRGPTALGVPAFPVTWLPRGLAEQEGQERGPEGNLEEAWGSAGLSDGHGGPDLPQTWRPSRPRKEAPGRSPEWPPAACVPPGPRRA